MMQPPEPSLWIPGIADMPAREVLRPATLQGVLQDGRALGTLGQDEWSALDPRTLPWPLAQSVSADCLVALARPVEEALRILEETSFPEQAHPSVLHGLDWELSAQRKDRTFVGFVVFHGSDPRTRSSWTFSFSYDRDQQPAYLVHPRIGIQNVWVPKGGTNEVQLPRPPAPFQVCVDGGRVVSSTCESCALLCIDAQPLERLWARAAQAFLQGLRDHERIPRTVVRKALEMLSELLRGYAERARAGQQIEAAP